MLAPDSVYLGSVVTLTKSVPLTPYGVEVVFLPFDHFTGGRAPWTIDLLVTRPLLKQKQKRKLRGFSPPVNYTDRATVACRRS
jgi:hypothetical protein